MKKFNFLLFLSIFLCSCVSTKIDLDDVFYAPNNKSSLINSKEYHVEVLNRKDFSPVCKDMILNSIAPSSKIIIELKILDQRSLKLIKSIYKDEDKEIAECINELLLKYDFPSFAVVEYKKTYPDNTYYNFSKVFKCSNKNIGQIIRYEMLPYSSDSFKQSLSVWDYLIINLSSFSLGCN